MPYYDYRCIDCGSITEVKRSIHQREQSVSCGTCGSTNVKRLFSVPNIQIHGKNKTSDSKQQEEEMKSELRDEYGVHSVIPCNRYGKKFEETYRDIKDRGCMVKEMMKAREEKMERKQRQKNRDWMKDALARTTKRGREKKERRAREEAEKRRIVVQS